MSGAGDGLQIVAGPADGWCDPDTGVCHIDTVDTVDEAAGAEATNEAAAGDVPGAPDATER